MKRINPGKVHAPAANAYSHVIQLEPAARLVQIAGQVGLRPDGTCSKDFTEQARQTWDNLLACLAEVGLGPQNLVKITVFLTRREDIPASREVRKAKLGNVPPPASTLLLVSGLASPDYLIEIEALAAG